MSLTMYQASVPVFAHSLGRLPVLLDKAMAFAEARKIEPSVLLNSRLAPDMFPLARQVQLASDAAKGAVARLAGVDVPSMADVEVTVEDLKQRVARTIDFVRSVQPQQIDGSEERPVVIKLRSGELKFTGQSYLLHFALPNFFFHVTTAYDILRHNGVEIGKRDYLGSV